MTIRAFFSWIKYLHLPTHPITLLPLIFSIYLCEQTNAIASHQTARNHHTAKCGHNHLLNLYVNCVITLSLSLSKPEIAYAFINLFAHRPKSVTVLCN
ncbi:hypothetical protein Hanom_Chr10g00947851 [Helianthus anomalus]